MKLSEAIRKGSVGMYQLFNGSISDGLGGVCALQAAERANPNAWPEAVAIPASCPICKVQKALSGAVICLNTRHKWSFERIADWVESIENAQEKKTEDCPVCEGKGKVEIVQEVEAIEK